MEVAITFIFVVGFVIVIVIVIANTIGPRPISMSKQSTHPKVTRIPPKSLDPTPIEGILGLVVMGALGFAAYKFIQSGGLRRLNEEIGKLPVNLNGHRTTIASAIREDSYVEQLLTSAIEKKMREVFEAGRPIESLENETPKAAADVASLLQEAIEARMRREGL